MIGCSRIIITAKAARQAVSIQLVRNHKNDKSIIIIINTYQQQLARRCCTIAEAEGLARERITGFTLISTKSGLISTKSGLSPVLPSWL